jgi:radical SAM protein with 4Fe4S-binding SPASM domain
MSDQPGGVTVLAFERLVGERPTRFHLRIDPDGGGLLLANAAEGAVLSPSGVIMVRALLEERPDEEIVALVQQAFRRAPLAQVQADLAGVRQLITDLATPGDEFPVMNLADAGVNEWERALAAPLQADVEQCAPERFRALVRKLWDGGIPHACVQVDRAGEPTQLPELIEAAGDVGMISGLRAAATWLSPAIIEACARAGLDHLDLLYTCHDPAEHDRLCGVGDYEAFTAAVAQAQDLELAVVAQAPLLARNLRDLDEMPPALQELGVANIVGFALACPDDDQVAEAAGALPARMLPQVATTFIELAESTRARYVWAPPVRFDNARSFAEQVRDGPRTSADLSVRVRADGTVLPARGRGSCGNLLAESWAQIWQHESFRRYREQLQAPARCPHCPDLPICAAACPLDPASWSDDRPGGDAR